MVSTAAFLGRLLNVRPGEWRRLLMLYAMELVVLVGLTWADNVVLGAFLQRVGVRYLPLVIVASAAASVAALFIYSVFADLVSHTRLLIGLLVVSGIGMLVGLAVLAAGLVGPGYLLLFLMLQVPLLDVFNVHWGTYINGFYDIRTAKRVLPVLSTSARVAGIVGGLSMPLMNRLLTPSAIIGVGVASLAIMSALAAAMPRVVRDKQPRRGGSNALAHGPAGFAAAGAPPQAAPEDRSVPPADLRGRTRAFARAYAARMREGYQQIARSPLLRWMALSTFSMTVLLVFLNYRASAIFQDELKTTVAISDFLGVLSGVANLVVLPFQLLVLSRVITRLGLGNASLIYPAVSLGIGASVAIAPSLSTAALAHLTRTDLRTAFRLPIDNLLYNAVPLRVKGRTRAFVGGLVVPIGAAMGGLLLLTPLVRTSWFLPAAIVMLALTLALTGLMVRRHYGPALLDLLQQEDYSSLALEAPSPQEPSDYSDPATLAHLAQKLTESTRPERTLFLAQLVTSVGGEAAAPLVGRAVRAAADPRLRASLLDVLAAAGVRSEGVDELFVELLADDDGGVRLAALGGLEQSGGPDNKRFLEVAARLLADPEMEVRLRVLPALLVADDAAHRAAAAAELRALLHAAEPRTRAQAVQVIGRAQALNFLLELVRAATDSADEVRLAAALAVEALAADESLGSQRPMLLALALLLLNDPVERARVAAISVLARLSKDSGLGASAACESLVTGLIDPSPTVQALSVDALVLAGPRAVPPIHDQLSAADSRARKLAAIALGRIEPRRYESVVLGTHLDDSLQAVSRNSCCVEALAGCEGPAARLLVCALGEQQPALLSEVFTLLCAVRDAAAIETIAHSLRSPQADVRANAVEALESLTTARTAALAGLLLDPNPEPDRLRELADQHWGIDLATPVAALRALLTDNADSWQHTLAAAALSELAGSADFAGDPEWAALLEQTRADPDAGVRAEVCQAAGGDGRAGPEAARRDRPLTLVERVILLREVPFFQGMAVNQLRALASVCEEEWFEERARIYHEGDAGGAFYLVVSGRVGIEREKRRGSYARLATVEVGGYFGEAEFLDDCPRSNSAIAVQGTLALRVRRQPLLTLVRQQPELSLELINVLSARLREANEQVAGLARTLTPELSKLYDALA